MPRQLQITVIGDVVCEARHRDLARSVGQLLARSGAVVLNGGRGGIMEAASDGAASEGGLVVGVLPGARASETPPNPHLGVVLFTGLQQARNQILSLSADCVIAIHGGWGTLSEIACALKFRIPVVLLESWQLERPDGVRDPMLHHARTAEEAVELALRLASARERSWVAQEGGVPEAVNPS